jgi:hypothetical protein
MNIQKLLNHWLTARELVIISREERPVLMAILREVK